MKFAVGFQLYDDGEEPFSEIIRSYKDSISEVFFPWQDFATGRSAIATRHGYTDWLAQERCEGELRAIKELGIKLDLLFNGNCYGEWAISERLRNSVASVIDHLDEIGCAVDIITTASPAIAHVVKTYYPDVEVRASVNMKIGTVKAMQYVQDLFDSFHVQREYNRDLNYLGELRKWADENGKKLIILANSGCLAHCSGQIFHDNMVAHEAEICEVRNMEGFNPYVCRRALKSREDWHLILSSTWIRPEDVHNYEGIVETMKLATRMHSHPGMVIHAYAKASFHGNTCDLLEPGYGRLLAPYIINNKAFPSEWFTKTSTCDKMCHRCGYCKSILDTVLLNTEGE